MKSKNVFDFLHNFFFKNLSNPSASKNNEKWKMYALTYKGLAWAFEVNYWFRIMSIVSELKKSTEQKIMIPSSETEIERRKSSFLKNYKEIYLSVDKLVNQSIFVGKGKESVFNDLIKKLVKEDLGIVYGFFFHRLYDQLRKTVFSSYEEIAQVYIDIYIKELEKLLSKNSNSLHKEVSVIDDTIKVIKEALEKTFQKVSDAYSNVEKISFDERLLIIFAYGILRDKNRIISEVIDIVRYRHYGQVLTMEHFLSNIKDILFSVLYYKEEGIKAKFTKSIIEGFKYLLYYKLIVENRLNYNDTNPKTQKIRNALKVLLTALISPEDLEIEKVEKDDLMVAIEFLAQKYGLENYNFEKIKEIYLQYNKGDILLPLFIDLIISGLRFDKKVFDEIIKQIDVEPISNKLYVKSSIILASILSYFVFKFSCELILKEEEEILPAETITPEENLTTKKVAQILWSENIPLKITSYIE